MNVRRFNLLHFSLVLLLWQLPHLPDALEVEGFAPGEWRIFKTICGVEVKPLIVFPDDRSLADERPAIVFLFGGRWKSGSPSESYSHNGYLAVRGIVAMAAEYQVQPGTARHLRNASGTRSQQPHGFFSSPNKPMDTRPVSEMDRFSFLKAT